jgi:hypothetical protein
VKQFDARAYSIADFLEWHSTNLLDISPKFQRRSVWTRAAKSFLIDTIIRGKPMPKILLTQDLHQKRNVRTVVDGQQRIRTIIEYINGHFTILRTHNTEYAGKIFSDLDEELQNAILQYEIGVDLLFNVGLPEMLDIFARINTYSVTLNTQEKLNAKYLGPFKTVAYSLGHSYVTYFLEGGILTEKQVSRMGEAQLASDLLVALVGGVQTTKNIERYYKKYEDAENAAEEVFESKNHFETTMSFVGSIYPADEIRHTNWSRPPWFYTLFISVAHCLHPLKGLDPQDTPELDFERVGHWRYILDDLSASFDTYVEDQNERFSLEFKKFVNYSQQRTTDTEARQERANYVLSVVAQ